MYSIFIFLMKIKIKIGVPFIFIFLHEHGSAFLKKLFEFCKIFLIIFFECKSGGIANGKRISLLSGQFLCMLYFEDCNFHCFHINFKYIFATNFTIRLLNINHVRNIGSCG